ncbi:MAG: hypothetical protein K6U87_10035 [Firmicutes bacterium]|nr:hypothetical protein [Bacillota bacterium]
MSVEGGLKGAAEVLAARLEEAQVQAAVSEEASGRVVRFSPDPEWPAYGALQWWLSVDEGDRLGCGLVVHKGLDPAARLYYAEVPRIMGPGWAWWRTVGAGPQDPFWPRVAETAQRWPVEVRLSVHNGLVPGFDPWSGPYRHQFVWTCRGEELQPAHPVWDFGPIAAVAEARTLPEAVKRLEESPDWRWLWAMVWIGWWWPAPDRPSAGQHLAESELWPRLRDFIPWFAASG